MKNKWFTGILITLAVLVVLVIVGAVAFRIGMAYNLPDGGRWQEIAPRAMPGIRWMPFVHRMPFVGTRWGGFSFLSCLVPLFFLLLLALAFRWGSHRHAWRDHHEWGATGVPPHLAEWHRKLHEEQAPGVNQPTSSPPDEPAA